MKINVIFSYDFFEHNNKEFDDKKHREMIFNFVKSIKKKISSIEHKDNINHEINKLFSGDDNDALFYTGTEEKINSLNSEKIKAHRELFLNKKITFVRNKFTKTKISGKSKEKRLLSYASLGWINSTEIMDSNQMIKDFTNLDLKNDKIFFLVVYPIKIDDFHK